MRQKYFKNSITAFLIISFILMPLGAIPKAEAQGISGYTSGLIPAIAKLPLCTNKLTGATKYLFGQASALTSGAAKLIADVGKKKAEEILKKELSKATSQFDKIGVYDEEANRKIDELKVQLSLVQKNTASIDINDTCLKSIGRLVIKMMLQKITLSTVAWINSGFDGKPAFIQDPGKFFNDIAKNEILQFGLEINNPQLFPFGRAWLQNQARTFNNKFADNARYSLNEMIQNTTPQYSAQSFQLDFSQGGWDAWSAMTQVPANNPLGFQLMASDELQRRLEGTQQSVAQNVRDALEQADGFLGDKRCADPQGLTREQHEKGVIARGKGDMTAPICLREEYVTPGKLIAEAATNTINYPTNNLLKAEDLNDAVAAILDALLSRFSADFMEKGYANFSDDGADGTFVYNQDSLGEDYTSQTEKDFIPVQLTSSWLDANPEFNIRTDLTQALIDEQRTYSDKLKLQNKELYSTADGKDYKMVNGISNAYGLIPAIDQLDYCIPGPHPGFEEDSQNALAAVVNIIPSVSENDLKNVDLERIGNIAKTFGPLAGAAVGATIGSAIPIVGTIIGAIVGTVVGAIFNWVFGGGDNAEKVRAYYYAHFLPLTGVATGSDGGSTQQVKAIGAFGSKGALTQTLNIILDRYIELVHKIYNPKVLPAVYKEATTEFNKLQGYTQMIKNNNDTISSMTNVVNTLGGIKDTIDMLNQKRDSNQMTDDEYENDLKSQINEFGRLSASMVNGDDIASSDNLLKQIVDEKNYIYKDLLKGPFGCEKDLELGNQNLPDQLYKTKRMNYPFPILYTYDVPAGGNIADPWNSGFANKTNIKATATYGPGFLSAYFFQTNSRYEVSNYAKTDCEVDVNGAVSTLCQLHLEDLLPLRQPGDDDWSIRSLGVIPSTTNTTVILRG